VVLLAAGHPRFATHRPAASITTSQHHHQPASPPASITTSHAHRF
jgi:hypothetical protein